MRTLWWGVGLGYGRLLLFLRGGTSPLVPRGREREAAGGVEGLVSLRGVLREVVQVLGPSTARMY